MGVLDLAGGTFLYQSSLAHPYLAIPCGGSPKLNGSTLTTKTLVTADFTLSGTGRLILRALDEPAEHVAETTSVHGITDTSTLATQTYADSVGAGGVELGYASITTSATSTTTFTSMDDIAGLSIDVTVATRPIMVEVWTNALYNTSTGGGVVILREGSTNLALCSISGQALNTTTGPISLRKRLTPTAGAHTYKASLARLSAAGTATLYADATTAAFIQAIEV